MSPRTHVNLYPCFGACSASVNLSESPASLSCLHYRIEKREVDSVWLDSVPSSGRPHIGAETG